MEEEPNWKGFWRCPDYKEAINDSPPFKYKCTGSRLTRKGVQELEHALAKEWLKRNAHKN